MSDHPQTDATVQPSERATSPTSLWPGLTDPGHSRHYTERFRRMAADGRDILGEARLVDAIAPRGARILDAGCGPGRHGGWLAGQGHQVVGVDVDPILIEAAREDHPQATWAVADLATLDLDALGHPGPYDVVLVAGNVMDFVTAEHRASVVRHLGAALAGDGRLVIGCRVGRGYTPADLDASLADAGLVLEQRFATWDLRPWHDGADFAVSLLSRA